MPVFIRNKKTQLYRAAAKGWVGVAEQALGFTSVPEATRFALGENMPETELVLLFGLLPDEVVVPVVPEYRDFGQPAAAAA
jgi:hypothetical protein